MRKWKLSTNGFFTLWVKSLFLCRFQTWKWVPEKQKILKVNTIMTMHAQFVI